MNYLGQLALGAALLGSLASIGILLTPAGMVGGAAVLGVSMLILVGEAATLALTRQRWYAQELRANMRRIIWGWGIVLGEGVTVWLAAYLPSSIMVIVAILNMAAVSAIGWLAWHLPYPQRGRVLLVVGKQPKRLVSIPIPPGTTWTHFQHDSGDDFYE